MSKTTNKKKINLIESYFETQKTIKLLETQLKELRAELLPLIEESKGLLVTDNLAASLEDCQTSRLDKKSLIAEMGKDWVRDRLKTTKYKKLTIKLLQDRRVA